MKIQQYVILLVAMVLIPLAASSTHLRGGYITYSMDAQDPLKFHFELYAYSSTGSHVQNQTIEINYGDGLTTNVNRESYKELKGCAALNYYKWTHTYQSAGIFTVAWSAANRNSGILNIASPSDLYPMQISATINAHLLRPAFNSVKFLAPAYAVVSPGKQFRYNLLATDADGDSLVYKLVNPSYTDGSNGRTPVPGYYVPTGLTINKHGEINWTPPSPIGEYNVTIEVEEYRDKVKIGSSIFELQLLTDQTEEDPEVILVNKEKLNVTNDGLIVAEPNVPLKLTFYTYDKNGYTSEPAKYLSEFQLDHTRQFVTETIAQRDSLLGKVLEVTIVPTTSLIRNQPYTVGVRASATTTNSSCLKVYNWEYAYILITEQSPMASVDHVGRKGIFIYPNPVSDKIFIQEIEQENAELQIWNVMGQQVVVTTLKAGKNIIKRPSHLASGTYFYYIVSNGRRIKAGKLFFD